MTIVLNTIKLILLHLLTKYAAELVFDLLIKTLGTAASETVTDFDDTLVQKVQAEREVILSIIKGS